MQTTNDSYDNEVAALIDQISQLDELAWGAEDREQLGKASAYRAKMRTLQVRLNEIAAAKRAPVQS